MIQITPHMKILVAVEPVDFFRKGIDGLAAVCRQALETHPMTGTLLVFFRRRHAIKCLVYDTQGFSICQKRLSQGRFKGWPTGQARALQWDPLQLQALPFWNGDPARTRGRAWS